ncbi:MAG TPA: hypothetical protein VNY73_03960, partial [Bacteroidia bacterium]|nr:hypothetical protein [Bacteroidia bacterium]
MTKKRWLWLSLSVAVLGILCHLFSFVSGNEIKNHTEKELHKLEHKAEVYLDSIHYNLHHHSKNVFVSYLAGAYKNTYNEEGIACFIYENDSLQYWTDSRVAVENYMLNVCLEKRLVKLKNGYYEVIRHPKNAYSTFQLYALVLVKSAFPYENRYLNNKFNEKFDLPAEAVFSENELAGKDLHIANYQGQTVFTLEMAGSGRRQGLSIASFFAFCFSLFFLLTFFLKNFLPENSENGNRKNFNRLFKWVACIVAAI